MLPLGDIGSLVSALVSGVSLLLTQLRGKEPSVHDDTERLRAALVKLDSALHDWAKRALVTNVEAHTYAEFLTSGRPTDAAAMESARRLARAMQRQGIFFPIGATLDKPFALGGDDADTVALRELLQAYAPDLADLGERFEERIRHARFVDEDLRRRYETGGQGAVDEALAELDRSQQALTAAADELGAFIRAEFPLRAGG